MADETAYLAGCQRLNADIGVLITVWQHTGVQAGLNISSMENIWDTPESIILEAVLEASADSTENPEAKKKSDTASDVRLLNGNGG